MRRCGPRRAQTAPDRATRQRATGRCAARAAARASAARRPTRTSRSIRRRSTRSTSATTKRWRWRSATRTTCPRWRCASSTSTARARRSPTRTRASRRSFRAACSRGQTPMIYEDGQQQRDFVHVSDIVQACSLAMANPAADYQVLNVGTGQPDQRAPGRRSCWRASWAGRAASRSCASSARATSATATPTSAASSKRIGYAPRLPLRRRRAGAGGWVAEQQGVPLPRGEVDRQLSSFGLLR